MPSGPKGKVKNRHALEAELRENERREQAKAKAEKEREDAEWADDRDAKRKKADERRAEQQRKLEEQQRRKEQNEAAYQAELRALSTVPPKDVTRREQQKAVTRDIVSGSLKGGHDIMSPPAEPTGPPPPPPRNVEPTQEESPRSKKNNDPAARAVVPCDRHMAKRARAAYRLFCEENLPKLKEAEQGKLRRSQFYEMLWAMWQKSPQNPFAVRAELLGEEAARQEWWTVNDDDDASDEEKTKAPDE